eukprot:scaffold205523_cov34-Tisochrysis_lutea.AAC.3
MERAQAPEGRLIVLRLPVAHNALPQQGGRYGLAGRESNVDTRRLPGRPRRRMSRGPPANCPEVTGECACPSVA